MKQIMFVATMWLASSSVAMASNCTITYSDNQTIYFNGIPTALTIPRDTPNGTVLYQESQFGTYLAWNCQLWDDYGIRMDSSHGSVSNYTTMFPLGKTGLSFRIWIDDYNRYEGSVSPAAPGSWKIQPGTYRLEIVKSGELAQNIKIAPGPLGRLISDNTTLKTFSLSSSITANTASCQTSSVPVPMGDDYELNEFLEASSTPRKVRFNISLNQCQAGIKKVTYSLKATTPVIDAKKGIVALNANSTAKGIGLQLMNDAGQPIAPDTTYPFTDFTTTDTHFKIPLSAAYYRLPTGDLEAGSANTEVTFIMSYL